MEAVKSSEHSFHDTICSSFRIVISPDITVDVMKEKLLTDNTLAYSFSIAPDDREVDKVYLYLVDLLQKSYNINFVHRYDDEYYYNSGKINDISLEFYCYFDTGVYEIINKHFALDSEKFLDDMLVGLAYNAKVYAKQINAKNQTR